MLYSKFFPILYHNCRNFAFGLLAGDLPLIPSFWCIFSDCPNFLRSYALLCSTTREKCKPSLFGDNKLVPFQLWWREIVLKREKIYKCFVQDCNSRSSHPEVFLGKGALKICSKFTGEHPCRSVISIKLLCSFIEITLRHGCPPVNLPHIFRTPFSKNTSGWLFL